MTESNHTPGRHRKDSARGNVYDMIRRATEPAQPGRTRHTKPAFTGDLSEVE